MVPKLALGVSPTGKTTSVDGMAGLFPFLYKWGGKQGEREEGERIKLPKSEMFPTPARRATGLPLAPSLGQSAAHRGRRPGL